MDISLPGLVVAAVSASIAFFVARAVVSAMRRRSKARDDANAEATQSRQVRRALTRKKRR